MAEEETFKVTDRRGRERPFAAGETAPSSPAAQEPAPPSDRRSERNVGREPPDLQAVFVMFATSALIGLGAAPNPADGDRSVDLDQAREGIDLLLLLRDKTEGHRTEDESRFLEHVLYDLQMRFVEVSGRASRA